MTHPLIPQILTLAAPIAQRLGLEVVGAVFQTNQTPPVLRVDVRNVQGDTGLDDCEAMSRALEASLDAENVIAEPYVLEISSPGLSDILSSDRDFTSFRGFPIQIVVDPAHEGRSHWQGRLIRRDETAVYLNQRGRTLAIPRDRIRLVQLIEAEGD
ncbi:ribosome maturation factor RimP [Trichothermofontia sichuanensis B231]|uniref:ribosome maturation factor RimP n=1 Tax=Trichothermofontia sichuanensis TaxID=3045816 RepID=UPI00224612BE|nr:ribosome maturation factor RimP [Trichothermofontia sichuanensis]UZQ53406.1 ribosome maturation factor RimP [Trichothermofontia sichuanensis B231]